VQGASYNADKMKESCMNYVKHQVRYRKGQGLADHPSYIYAAHRNGMKVLLSVLGEDTDVLAADINSGSFQSYVDQYSTFVAQLAGDGADAIEIWNEPNVEREWPAGQIKPALYAQLFKASYDKIKAATQIPR